MNNQPGLYPFRPAALFASTVLPLFLLLAGCSASRPAPDACRMEVSVDGHPTGVERLTETAPVSDWAEEWFCLFHPIDCIRALSVKGHIRQWEQDMAAAGFWERASLQGGLGDAARHAYLACLLTEQSGAEFTTGLLEAHEEDSALFFGFGTALGGNMCCNRLMDEHNNRVGIGLATQPGDCEEKIMDSLPLLRHSLCRK